MKASQAIVGTRVRTLVPWCDVPVGTIATIDEDYGTGVMLCWHLPGNSPPEGYREHDGRPAIQHGLLRDGFDKKAELKFLEVVT